MLMFPKKILKIGANVFGECDNILGNVFLLRLQQNRKELLMLTHLMLKPLFFVTASRGRRHRLQNFMCYLMKLFPKEFMASITSFKSSVIQHDVQIC